MNEKRKEESNRTKWRRRAFDSFSFLCYVWFYHIMWYLICMLFVVVWLDWMDSQRVSKLVTLFRDNNLFICNIIYIFYLRDLTTHYSNEHMNLSYSITHFSWNLLKNSFKIYHYNFLQRLSSYQIYLRLLPT